MMGLSRRANPLAVFAAGFAEKALVIHDSRANDREVAFTETGFLPDSEFPVTPFHRT
jgi:hypothetical protein